ncbi:hypothetical protein JCM13991_00550 [Thermodesulfovibrio hydrogeniphilus]
MQRITIFIFLFFIFTANLHAYEKPRIFVIPFEVGISRVPNDTAKEITDLFVSALIKSKSVEVIDAQKIENFSKDLDFEQILKIAKSAKSNKIFMGKINQVELPKNSDRHSSLRAPLLRAIAWQSGAKQSLSTRHCDSERSEEEAILPFPLQRDCFASFGCSQ